MKPQQVADRLGISTSVLRSWDREGVLIPSARTPGGHRRYTEDDIRGVTVVRVPQRGAPATVQLVRGEQMEKAD